MLSQGLEAGWKLNGRYDDKNHFTSGKYNDNSNTEENRTCRTEKVGRLTRPKILHTSRESKQFDAISQTAGSNGEFLRYTVIF